MTDEVLFTREGHLGLITLNRPESLNALTLTMITAIQNQLSFWNEDADVHAIIMRAAPGKAFCAGGDVRWLYHFGQGTSDEQLQFFWHEYHLNHFIQQLGKPYIALMDGITLGGGVGISLHGSHPIASERFIFAMPETSIGFFPDIGASHLLTQCPGALGIYLGLTGDKLSAYQALQANLIKGVVCADKMDDFIAGLHNLDLATNATKQVDKYLHTFASQEAEPLPQQNLIDSCFANNSIEEIMQALADSKSSWAEQTLKVLSQKSPLSLKITLAQLQKAQGLSLGECLKMDYTLVNHFMNASDFYEGVRALLIDKDKNPQWNPASLELVTQQMVDDYFETSLLESMDNWLAATNVLLPLS